MFCLINYKGYVTKLPTTRQRSAVTEIFNNQDSRFKKIRNPNLEIKSNNEIRIDRLWARDRQGRLSQLVVARLADVHFALKAKVFRLRAQDSGLRRNG
jgi:hypothetical protein